MTTTTYEALNRSAHRDKLLPGRGILVSRGLVYVSSALIVAVVSWCCIARLDVAVEARGRLVVRGQPVEVAAPRSALVVDVPVRVGDHVDAGAVLLRIDAHAQRSEVEQVEARILSTEKEVERHREAAAALSRDRVSIEAERDAVGELVNIAVEEVERMRTLLADGIVSPADLRVGDQRLAEARARQARVRVELERHDRSVKEELRLADEASSRAEELRRKHAEVEEYERRSAIRAPVAGTITHLAVRHPGSRIDSSGPAVIIAPDDQPLLASVDVPNRSMRRLRPGLATSIELDAFPHEDFGFVEGTVLEIEPDADASGSYRAWISLERSELPRAELTSRLKPGLLLDARVVVERRTIADLLFRPLRRLARQATVSE